MLLDVVNVKTTPDFQLDLDFQNCEHRRFDMRPLLTMRPRNRIATEQLFHCASVAYGTGIWLGEIDIAPENRYDDSVPMIGLASGLSRLINNVIVMKQDIFFTMKLRLL